jgi:hypothetical protein
MPAWLCCRMIGLRLNGLAHEYYSTLAKAVLRGGVWLPGKRSSGQIQKDAFAYQTFTRGSRIHSSHLKSPFDRSYSRHRGFLEQGKYDRPARLI